MRAAVGPVTIAPVPMRKAIAHPSRRSVLVTHSGMTITPRCWRQMPAAMRLALIPGEMPHSRICGFSTQPPWRDAIARNAGGVRMCSGTRTV